MVSFLWSKFKSRQGLPNQAKWAEFSPCVSWSRPPLAKIKSTFFFFENLSFFANNLHIFDKFVETNHSELLNLYWQNYKWKFYSQFWKYLWMLSESSFFFVDFIKFSLFSSILIYLWLSQSSIINMSSFKPGAVFNPRDNTNGGRKQSFDDNKKKDLADFQWLYVSIVLFSFRYTAQEL